MLGAERYFRAICLSEAVPGTLVVIDLKEVNTLLCRSGWAHQVDCNRLTLSRIGNPQAAPC